MKSKHFFRKITLRIGLKLKKGFYVYNSIYISYINIATYKRTFIFANFKLKLESAMCDSIDAKNAKNVKESLDALESNVLKVVRGIKKMNPAKKNGEPVKCRYSIPFTYYL